MGQSKAGREVNGLNQSTQIGSALCRLSDNGSGCLLFSIADPSFFSGTTSSTSHAQCLR